MQNVTKKLIQSFAPCYDPQEIGLTDDLSLTPLEFIEMFQDKVKSKEDILWLFCRKEFMTDRDLRLFAVWCARESFKSVENIDPRSIEAANVAEKYANGEASLGGLSAAARSAESAAWSAWSVAEEAARSAEAATATAVARSARSAAWAASRPAWPARAAWAAAEAASRSAEEAARSAEAATEARSAQIEHLKTYFKDS